MNCLISDTPRLEGLNVTVPHKKAVVSYLDEMDEVVRMTGACNCIRLQQGKLKGYNTDVTGFEQSLSPLLQTQHTKALILGTGGSAVAVQYVMEKLGIEYKFVSRKPEDKGDVLTYEDLTAEVLREYLLIINTTPVGMFPRIDECPSIPYEHITQGHLLFDLVYNPTETLFLRKGKERNAVVKNGLEMLSLQAEESWRIWNSVMRDLIK